MENLLSATDIARLLQVCKRTVQKLAEAGVMPNYVRIGRQRRWRKQDIEEWINKEIDKQ